MVLSLLHQSLGPRSTAGADYAATDIGKIQIVGLALATLSLLADSIALYWFGRAKRKLRHDLIIFLLSADLLKSLNTIVFSAIALSGTGIRSASGYCQASGFLGEYFVEVTDFAILAMIVHMSLCVLKPDSTTDGEGGLFRWKPFVFSAVLGMPLIMSSLAFINPRSGYALEGAFCQLPIRPVWSRLLLDWLPRYCIIITIVTLTFVTWTKVRRLQRKLADLQANEPIALSNTIEEESDFSPDPARGRLDSVVGSLDKDKILRPASSHMTLASTNSTRPLRPASSYTTFQSTRPLRPASSYNSITTNPRPPLRPTTSHPILPVPRERARSLPPTNRSLSHTSLPSIWDEIDASLPRHSFRLSTVDLQPPPFSRPSSPTKQPRRWTSRLSILSLARQELSELDLLTRRQRYISRQLRATLFYPLVYAVLWAAPLALHVYQLATGDLGPAGLALAATAEMAAFGAVNAVFFVARERAWRLPRREREGKWDFKG